MNKNQSCGCVGGKKNASHTCTPVVARFTRAGFALWNIAVIVNASCRSSLGNLHHLEFFFPLFFFSHSIFSKPWRCLWPVSAPSLVWVCSGSSWLGSGPCLGPSHLARRTPRPGLSSSEACFFFFTREKTRMPLSPHQ